MTRLPWVLFVLVLGTAVGLAVATFDEPFAQRFRENAACCQMPAWRNTVVSAREVLGLATYPSQSGQDKWVLDAMFPGETAGYFLDVGSGDGFEHSNTWALEQRGWSGICVDPFPSGMEGRRCRVFEDVVWSSAGREMTFHTADGVGGLADTLDRWKEEAVKAPTVRLKTVTLADILARARAPAFIHFVSLDIEGAELEALKAFPFDRHRVGAIVVEHNYEEPKRVQIVELLWRRGYERVHTYYQDDFFAPAVER
jgi:FkbM family methyltransferase